MGTVKDLRTTIRENARWQELDRAAEEFRSRKAEAGSESEAVTWSIAAAWCADQAAGIRADLMLGSLEDTIADGLAAVEAAQRQRSQADPCMGGES